MLKQFIISLAVFGTICPNLQAQTKKPRDILKLGYLTDLSAKGAFIGLQSQAGAELALRELNANEVKVKIIFEDQRTEAKAAINAAKKLLEVDKVDAVLCDLTIPCTAASPLIAAEKKLIVYQSPAVSILNTNPYAFKNFVDYKEGCKQIAKRWKQEGILKIAHLKMNAEFGELCLQGSQEIFPEQEVYEYNSNDEIRTFVSKFKVLGIEAVLQTGFEADFINQFRAASDLRVSVLSGMAQPLLTQKVFEVIKSSALRDLTVFGYPKISEEFIAKLRSAGLLKSDVNIESAAMAYLHVKQIVAALMQCPDKNIECEIAKVQASAADPNFGFEGWKDRVAVYPYKLRKWERGEFVEVE